MIGLLVGFMPAPFGESRHYTGGYGAQNDGPSNLIIKHFDLTRMKWMFVKWA